MLKCFFNQLADFFGKYLFLILILLGLFLLFIEISFFTPTQAIHPVKQLIHPIAISLLTGGIFASLLKSYQYLGIFKQELAKVVTNPELFLNDNYIEKIWKNLSKTMYKNKFPIISEELQSIIAKEYFPVAQNHYKQDHTINITLTDPKIKDFVDITEVVSLTIIPTDIIGNVHFGSSSSIPLNDISDSETFYDLTQLTINNCDFRHNKNLNFDQKKTEKSLITKWSVDLPYSKQYAICYKLTKRMSLEKNSTFGFRTTHFINNLIINIIYPSTLIDVDFYSAGTIGDFGGLEPENGSLTKRYDGLILPKQGFRVFYRRKSN